MAASNPKALCVDTRTLREFPDTLEKDPPDLKYKDYDKDYYRIAQEFYAGITRKFKRPAEGRSAILVGLEVWEKINALLIKHQFAKDDVLLMVLPTPFFGHPFHIYAQEATYRYPSARYQGDWEQFDNNTSQRVALICLLKERFNPSAIVIFSGDVHYSSVINGGYAFAQTVKDAENKKWKWTIPVIQITSSPIKNVKDQLRKAVEGVDGILGIATEMLAPESRVRYTMTSKGSFIAVGLNTASLSGDLGKNTLIHQNNICIVTMPIAPENQVKSLFVGYKNGNLAKAKTEIHIHNNGFMKPIYDLLHPTKFTIIKGNIGRILGSYVKAAGTFNKYATMLSGNYSLFDTALDAAKLTFKK